MVKYMQNKDNCYLPPARRDVWRLWDIRSLNMVILVAWVALFAGYLAISNQATANGFTIKAIEQRMADLEDQRRRLDLDVLGKQSMGNVVSQVQGLGFVPVQGIDYLTAVGGPVAVK